MALLEVRGLVKYYGRRCVVDGVNFEVNAGEVVGLLGPNGAGKTTSFRMTTGQITPYKGQVLFNGHDVTHLPMYKRARLGMGYLSQETSVFRKLTVEQNILAILEIMPMARTLGRSLTRAERWQRTEEVLQQFGLTKVRKNMAARLSGGEKRRLEIARCLVCEPLLILLDEPFTGIDPITISDIRQIILALRDHGIGMLLTDHNVREALKITTRSYLIKDGKVRTHGTPQQIIHDPIAISEYLGAGFNDDSFAGSPPDVATPMLVPSTIEKLSEPRPVEQPISRVQPSRPPLAQPRSPKLEARPISYSNQPISRPLTENVERSESPTKGLALQMEQEKILRLIEGLKSPDYQQAAADLAKKGNLAIPALLAALERRDVELRRQAIQVLQKILQRPLFFDPYAPEAMRKQQLVSLREQFERKAG